MGTLILSICSHFLEKFAGPIMVQIFYFVIDQLSNFMLSAFKFSTLQEVVIDLPGLEGADNALLYMAFGLAIILFTFGIYQYFISAKGSREGAVTQIFRFSIVCFFIGNSTLVIEKVLSITYKIYTLAVNSNTWDTYLNGENFDNLIDAMKNPSEGAWIYAENAVNAAINWNLFSMIAEAIFLIILVWYVIKLWLKMFERYVNFIVELYLFPVTVSFAANASLQDVFFTYLRAIISQYMILLINVFFLKVALYNIVNGIFLALVNRTNVFMSFFFSVAFIKIALKAEELIQTWGLFGMSAGTVMDDARNLLGVMRDGALFMGGSMGGSVGGKGAIGGTAKSFASAISNSKLGSFVTKHGPGNAVLGGILGAKNGIQNGKGIGGKIAGAASGGIKGLGFMTNKSSELYKAWNQQKKAGATAKNVSLQNGASLDEAKKLEKQAKRDKRTGKTTYTAAETKRSKFQGNSLQTMANKLCTSSTNPNGFVSKNLVSAAATRKKENLSHDLTAFKMQSLVGTDAMGNKQVGACTGGSYNEATGTASLTYCKTNEEGKKEYTQATAIPFNDTDDGAAGYSTQLNKLMDSSDIKFTESISDDGQKWAIIPDENMPSAITDEMDSRLSKANTAINEDLQKANDKIKGHNSDIVKPILETSPEKFIQCDKDGSNMRFCGEDETAAEAFRDYISNNNFPKASSGSSYDLDEAARDVFQNLNDENKIYLKSYWKYKKTSDK